MKPNLISPDELSVQPLLSTLDKQMFTIVFNSPSDLQSNIEERLSAHSLYYDKAQGDANIVMALEELIKTYENRLAKLDNSSPEQIIFLSKTLDELRDILYNCADLDTEKPFSIQSVQK